MVNPNNYLESCYSLKEELLSDNEMEPYIRSLFLVARKKRISFVKHLEDSLNELFFRANNQIKNDIMGSEIGAEVNTIFTDIKNGILFHAKKMFPRYKYD